MSLLLWNCRCSGGTTISTVNRYLRCTREKLAFISEIRCNEKMAIQRIKTLSLCNYVVVPADGQSGGLWIIWDDDIKVEVIEKDKSLIAVEINEQGAKMPWILVGVYGDPARAGNQRLWQRLEGYLKNDEKPVCLIGDFNAIASES